MTAIDRAALIEAAAEVLDDSYSRWCDRVEDEPFVPETEHEAMAEAVLPVIARELLAPLRALHARNNNPRYGCCATPKVCTDPHRAVCSAFEHGLDKPRWPCPTVCLLDQIEADVAGGGPEVTPVTALEVTVEPYDLQHGRDWPAQRGRCFVTVAGDCEYRVWVSDCGHVSLGEGLVGGGGREAAPTLAEAEALLAALTAAVAAARQAAADYAELATRCTCPETSEAERAATYCTETGYEPHGCLCPPVAHPAGRGGRIKTMTAETPRGGAEFAKFLLARIAEDEDELKTARIGDSPEWWEPAQWYRERAEAECAAKRAIVERYVDNLDLALSYRKLPTTGYAAPNAADRLEHQLQEARLATSLEACVALVAVYADHPDYDDTWIPR